MKGIAALFVLCACGGPSQQQLAETPTAKTRATPAEAPPASTSDQDRAHLVQQFDDMQATQQAHKEAKQGSAPAPAPKKGEPPPKKGPAEQATLPPKK